MVENCSDGKFLIFKHSSLPDFTLTLMFRKKFNLLPDKEYTIRFSYFFEDCSQSGEKLNMEIFVVGPTQEQNYVYTSDDRVIGGNVAKWSQQVVCFQVGKADSYSVKSDFFFFSVLVPKFKSCLIKGSNKSFKPGLSGWIYSTGQFANARNTFKLQSQLQEDFFPGNNHKRKGIFEIHGPIEYGYYINRFPDRQF